MSHVKNCDEINDIRTNIIETVLRLYRKLNEAGCETHLTYERYELHFVPKRGLWIDGCADKVFTKDDRYASISLGQEIRSYEQVPYEWLRSLLVQ